MTRRPVQPGAPRTIVVIVALIACAPLCLSTLHAQDDAKPRGDRRDAQRGDRPDGAEASDKPRFDRRRHDKDGRRDDNHDRPDAEPLTDEEIDVGLKALSEASPGFGKRLTELRERDPDQFRKLLTRTPNIARRIREVAMDAQRDPDGFKLRAHESRHRAAAFMKTRELVKATPEQQEAIKTELTQIGGKLFDATIARRRHDLERIDERANQLTRQLAGQRDNRDEIIDQLTGDAIKANLQHVMPVYLDMPGHLFSRGDGDSGRRRAEGKDDGPDLKPEQVEKILEYVHQKNPDLARQLERLREDNPMMFRRTLLKMRQKLLPRIQQRDDDPEAAKIMAEALQLRKRLKKLIEHDGKRDKHRDKVRKSVAELVELRFNLREHEIGQIASRLDRIRDDLAEQEKNREQMVAQRLAEIQKFAAKMGERGHGHERPSRQRPGNGTRSNDGPRPDRR